MRLEESKGTSAGSTTIYTTLDTLVDGYLGNAKGKGMALVWMKDLDTPEYQKAQEPFELNESNPDTVAVDENGGVTLRETENGANVGAIAVLSEKPAEGLLKGRELQEILQSRPP